MKVELFNKYLITSDKLCYSIYTVKDDKEFKVLSKLTSKSKEVDDFSNFSSPIYYSNFKQCLNKIIDLELKTSDITSLRDVITVIENLEFKIREML